MKSNETLCNQVYEYVKNNIDTGFYGDGKLPTEAELAAKFFVSRITVKNAMTRLVDEGVIIRIQGKGSFVKAMEVPGTAIQQNEKSAPPKTIALVMGGYTSSFGLEVLNGAMDEAQKHNTHLIVTSTNNDQSQETDIIASLINDGVSGLIVQPVHGETYSKQIIKAIYSGYSIVMLDRCMQGIDAPYVGVDDRELSRRAVDKLLDSNHTDIALLALANDRSSTIRERMDGFRDACVDRQVVVNKDLWLVDLNAAFEHPPELLNPKEIYESYVSQIEAHLKAHPEITAIFGTEYYVSKAAWDALSRIGKRVPEDVSLVSFDMDLNYVGIRTMSHIRQPQTEMGRNAVKLLLDTIDHKPQANQQCLLAGEWIDGGTIAMRKV